MDKERVRKAVEAVQELQQEDMHEFIMQFVDKGIDDMNKDTAYFLMALENYLNTVGKKKMLLGILEALGSIVEGGLTQEEKADDLNSLMKKFGRGLN